ncbi:MAG: site-specific integrase [Syntrophales bacterium]|jgi:integrase
MKRTKTKFTGVFERTSEIRKNNSKPDVCYDICYRIGDQLKWEKIGWASEGYSSKLASQVRADRIRLLRHGKELPLKKKAPLFSEAAQKYLDWAKSNKTRSGVDDISRYKNYLSEPFDNKRLNEISPLDLENLKKELFKKNLSPSTVKHALALSRQIYNKAILWGIYEGENPIKGVKMPAIQNQRQRFLSHDEADVLLADLAIRSKQLHNMAFLSLHTGMRAGEIFNLKGQDIDLVNGIINISDSKNKQNRKAFMTKAVKAILKTYKPDSPDEYIFKDKKHGGKIEALSQSFLRAVNDLKLNKGITDPRQKITFHSLRHTFASWLALQGETIQVIAELLGHKSLAMTMRYSHLLPDQKRRAVLNMESAHVKLKNQKTKQNFRH